MPDLTIDAVKGAGRLEASGARVRDQAAEAARASRLAEMSEAHPPEVAHWDLPVRAAVVLALAVLSWVVIGGGLFLLLRH